MSAALRNMAPLEAQARVMLGARVCLAAVQADAPALPAGGTRSDDRRLGRAALARLLGHSPLQGHTHPPGRAAPAHRADTVRFPHPTLSLSHSGAWAIAASCASADGFGVDLEFERPMDPRAARFYLVDGERDYIAALPPGRRDSERLRLWTVKEAVFKACADNAGRLLLDFRIDAPAAPHGTARRVDGVAFVARYGSIDLDGGWLAVARAGTEPNA